MKYFLKISVLIFVVLSLIVCKKEQDEEFVPQKNELYKQKQIKTLSNNNLSIKFFKSEVFSNLKNKNIIISNYSFSNFYKDATLNFAIKSKYEDKELEMPFYYSPSNSSFVKMISSKYYFNYYSGNNIQSVIIPLKNSNYNMQVIISNANNSLSNLINKLNCSFLKNINSKMKKNKMQVILPKFQIEHTQKSKIINLKIKNNNNVKYSFFSDEDENSYKTLFINQAFIFIISEKKSNAILFIGKVNRPYNN